jgi:hypothetical protein
MFEYPSTVMTDIATSSAVKVKHELYGMKFKLLEREELVYISTNTDSLINSYLFSG